MLCRRTKLRVNMTLFNCVWDAKRRLRRKDRRANRSDCYINAMLIKAVHRREILPYTDDEIAKCNHIRSCQLKKDNNCRLDRWRCDQKYSESAVLQETRAKEDAQLSNVSVRESQLWHSETLELNKEVCALDAMHINTLSMSIDTQLTQTLNQELESNDEDWALDAMLLNVESMSIDAPSTQELENDLLPKAESITRDTQLTLTPNQELEDWAMDAMLLNTESIDIDTHLTKAQIQELENKIDKWVLEALRLNTASMAIDKQLIKTPNQELENNNNEDWAMDAMLLNAKTIGIDTQLIQTPSQALGHKLEDWAMLLNTESMTINAQLPQTPTADTAGQK
ncbi:telomere-binding protein cav-like isoform X2 [Drosophila montana]